MIKYSFKIKTLIFKQYRTVCAETSQCCTCIYYVNSGPLQHENHPHSSADTKTVVAITANKDKYHDKLHLILAHVGLVPSGTNPGVSPQTNEGFRTKLPYTCTAHCSGDIHFFFLKVAFGERIYQMQMFQPPDWCCQLVTNRME